VGQLLSDGQRGNESEEALASDPHAASAPLIVTLRGGDELITWSGALYLGSRFSFRGPRGSQTPATVNNRANIIRRDTSMGIVRIVRHSPGDPAPFSRPVIYLTGSWPRHLLAKLKASAPTKATSDGGSTSTPQGPGVSKVCPGDRSSSVTSAGESGAFGYGSL
jgi:hypothetical protein